MNATETPITETPVIDPRRRYSAVEACAIIPSSRRGKRFSLNTFYRWREEGVFRALKIGGCWFVTGAELIRLLHMDVPQPPISRTPSQREAAGRRAMEEFESL